MAQQPFYHRIDGLLFTATREVSEEDFTRTLTKALKGHGLVEHSIQIEDYNDPEPGDPADL